MKLLMAILAGLSVTISALPQRPAVVVVSVADVEAYTQTIAGIREQLPDAEVWDVRDEGRLRENFSKKKPAVAIALGSSAAAVLERAAPSDLALVEGLVLDHDLERGSGRPARYTTAVTVDLPPEVLLRELKRSFPGRNRIGVIRGPAQTAVYMKTFEQAARRNGLSVEVVSCSHPRELVEAFLKLRSSADLVWCPPDAQIYTSATLKPLLIASLTNRLPIIGFSEQFVQAGALFGGNADFADVGRQTAALAIRVARGEPVPSREEARNFRFAYNQRVARMLGVRAAGPAPPGSEIVVIR